MSVANDIICDYRQFPSERVHILRWRTIQGIVKNFPFCKIPRNLQVTPAMRSLLQVRYVATIVSSLTVKKKLCTFVQQILFIHLLSMHNLKWQALAARRDKNILNLVKKCIIAIAHSISITISFSTIRFTRVQLAKVICFTCPALELKFEKNPFIYYDCIVFNNFYQR